MISKRQIRLELPSGRTLQQKISQNMDYWKSEIESALISGDLSYIENRIRDNIKNLAGRIDLVVTPNMRKKGEV